MRVELSSIEQIPGTHRKGHTCANLNGELLFVWGGEPGRRRGARVGRDEPSAVGEQQQQQHGQVNTDLWIYETLTGYWRQRQCSGQCPPHLSSSSSCIIGQRMFVFGGFHELASEWLNCLYSLDLQTFEWAELGSKARADEPTKPVRSDKSVSWSIHSKLYVFGGYGSLRTESLLHILDRQSDFQLTPDPIWPRFGWNNQLVEFDPAKNTWRWPSYSGRCPTARAAHSGAMMGDGKFYLFGGRDCSGRLNDLYTLDMRSLEWSLLAVVESELSPVVARSLPELVVQEDEESQRRAREDAEHGEIVDEIQEAEQQQQMFEPEPSSSRAGQASPAPSHLAAQPVATSSRQLAQDDQDEEECPVPAYLLERWACEQVQLGQVDSSSICSDDGDTPKGAAARGQSNQELGDAIADTGTTESGSSMARFQRQHSRSSSLETNDQHESDESDYANRAIPQPDNLLPAPRAEHQANQPAQIDMNDGAHVDGAGDTLVSKPAGRSFCSFTPISDEDIFLFGGVSATNQNLYDCWRLNIRHKKWYQLGEYNSKHKRPRRWHTGSWTKQNEVVIIGGSSSDSIDEFCCDVMAISLGPKPLKRLALDAVSRLVRLKTIQNYSNLPSTMSKQIRLRKQAIALTAPRRSKRQTQQNGTVLTTIS